MEDEVCPASEEEDCFRALHVDAWLFWQLAVPTPILAWMVVSGNNLADHSLANWLTG